MSDVLHVKKHVEDFYASLTPEELEVDKKERERGTWDKITAVMTSKDPKKAAEDLEKEMEGKE